MTSTRHEIISFYMYYKILFDDSCILVSIATSFARVLYVSSGTSIEVTDWGADKLAFSLFKHFILISTWQ